MNYDHLFILTYGRSGSTLLQGVLNSIPGVVIRGENAGALRPLFNSWRAVRQAKSIPVVDRTSPASPWYGADLADADVYAQGLVHVFRSQVLAPPPQTKTIGFKEIRYYPALCPELRAEMEFMRMFFSRAGFVINTREIEATIRSSAQAKHDVTPQQIWASDRRFRQIASEGFSDVFHVHYDDYIAEADHLKPLFDWLGAEWDPEAVAEVMAVTHSTRMQS